MQLIPWKTTCFLMCCLTRECVYIYCIHPKLISLAFSSICVGYLEEFATKSFLARVKFLSTGFSFVFTRFFFLLVCLLSKNCFRWLKISNQAKECFHYNSYFSKKMHDIYLTNANNFKIGQWVNDFGMRNSTLKSTKSCCNWN